MKKLLILLSIFCLSINCKNKTENKTDISPTQNKIVTDTITKKAIITKVNLEDIPKEWTLLNNKYGGYDEGNTIKGDCTSLI